LVAALICGLALALVCSAGTPVPETGTVSKEAAARCVAKLQRLEESSKTQRKSADRTTRFTQEEVNSYLALNLSSRYHPSLKNLAVTFVEKKLQAVVTIDFDRLGENSTGIFPRLIGTVFSGVHTLSARGELVSGNRKAHFALEEAKFDDTSLPRSLVEQIISAVGKKQNPPFDPLQPSELPYAIEKVDVHHGYIVVYQ